MKTYIITEQDIERLRCNLESHSDGDWWYIGKLDEWEEKLNFVSDVELPYSGLIEEDDNL